jgi:hypothetical protein
MDDAGELIVKKESVRIQDRADDPETDATLCTDVETPYPCCTGAYPADSNDGCDEELTDFTDFVQGFGVTLNTRVESKMWQDIQNKYSTQAK